MSNFGWMNEDGEPIMDGAAYRYEQSLDEQYAYERAYDYDNYYEVEPPEVDPDDCLHPDGTYLGSGDENATGGDFECDACFTVIPNGWVLAENGWPERV